MSNPTGDAMKAEAEQLRAEIARLRDGLQMIVKGTVCPAIFGDLWDRMTPPQQMHVSALVIARATLEGGFAHGLHDGSPHVKPKDEAEANDRIGRCVREIEMICDEFEYNSTAWLRK